MDGVDFYMKPAIHTIKKFFGVFLAAVMVLIPLSACAAKQGGASGDVLSQKQSEKGKTQLTVLVKNAFSINGFEAAAEEKFPQLDLVQVGNYTCDRGLLEYERRLQNDDLTDIVMTWPLDIGKEYWTDRLLDLSGMSFTSNYNISMLNTIEEDGALYYLPGPAQVRGIVYNKTLFQENNWKVPTDFDGFIELCHKIEETGIRSIQLGFQNSEVLDTAFVGYSYGDCFSKPQDAQWLREYNKGVGSIGLQLGVGLDTFQLMIDEGIWKQSDLEMDYATRERMLFTRKCAMVEDSVLMARMGYSISGTKDEFALMPFFSPEDNSDWARLYMVCYIGMNKHLADSENKGKYDLAVELMEYISTPEGQAALSADTGAMYSSVEGVPPPDVVEIEALIPTLNAGRYAIFPELERSQSALREGLKGMLEGSMTKDDVIELVDNANKAEATKIGTKVLGTATEDFTLIETGSCLTDIMRDQAETDIALFLDNGKDGRANGKGVSGKIYKGEQTDGDIQRILPDTKEGEKGALLKGLISGKDLITTLEYAIPVGNDDRGWFYYFSGLRMEFDPIADPGSRIKKITDAEGNAIDPEKQYSIAMMDASVPEELIQDVEDTGLIIGDIFSKWLVDQGEISPVKDNRFQVAS